MFKCSPSNRVGMNTKSVIPLLLYPGFLEHKFNRLAAAVYK